MANIICFKQEKGLKNCSNRQLKVTAKHKIYPDGQKNAHLENRRGVGHCPMCSVTFLSYQCFIYNIPKSLVKEVDCNIDAINKDFFKW